MVHRPLKDGTNHESGYRVSELTEQWINRKLCFQKLRCSSSVIEFETEDWVSPGQDMNLLSIYENRQIRNHILARIRGGFNCGSYFNTNSLYDVCFVVGDKN